MNNMRIVAKISVICWAILAVCFVLFILLGITNFVAFGVVWMLLGVVLMLPAVFYVRRIAREGGFELSYFLVVEKGYREVICGLLGLVMFVFGALRMFVPQLAEDLLGKHIMSFAAVMVFLFWLALIFMFLGWALTCFSESIGYFRLNKIKDAFYAFGLGGLWIAFTLICCSLFMDVISDENFFPLAASTQNWILVFVGLAIVVTGLYAGRYEDLKALAEDKPEEE